jgi:adenine deaminase
MKNFTCTANHVDILAGRIRPSVLTVTDGRVGSIEPLGDTADTSLPYMLPGFIDAHVHIESSMLVPSEFARLAVVHGTVATVSDPHEIANVLGEAGVLFMLENAATVPFRFFFGAPSCVPATAFETAGARLDAAAVRRLLQRPDILYLSEMMNFPGVLSGDAEVREKIAAAVSLGKPVDGHAPGLRGRQARRYAGGGEAGRLVISTDHECFTRREALDKLDAGMHILIREGSAARNFDALAGLIAEYPDRTMFCSDDKHPDSLVEGHINVLVRRAVQQGLPLFNVLKAACVNPVLHYRLPVGLLRRGEPADFIVVEDLAGFAVRQTYIGGALVAEKGSTLIAPVSVTPVNRFHCTEKAPEDFAIAPEDTSAEIAVIGALDGELITEKLRQAPRLEQGHLLPDPARDLLKIAVVNRYGPAPVAVAFVSGFGLKEGAIASSVAHDSHNIIAVGATDEALARAVNLVVGCEGGISTVSGASEKVLALPVAGLMSADDGYKVAASYSELDAQAKEMGSRLRSPFMTLSFMALLVIPHLKLSDLGLFDGDRFTFTSLVPPVG